MFEYCQALFSLNNKSTPSCVVTNNHRDKSDKQPTHVRFSTYFLIRLNLFHLKVSGLHFKRHMSVVGNTMTFTESVLNVTNQYDQDYFWKESTFPPTVSDVRGKIVILHEWDG